MMDQKQQWPIREAAREEIDALARLWFDGWQDAHAEILPGELKRLRTLQSFRERLGGALPDLRTAGPTGAPHGFVITKGDELYQLYVSPLGRGSGLAARLTADALCRIEASGHRRAWLACAIGNERAARFYKKAGWSRWGVMTSQLPINGDVFALNVWRYEISLDGS